MTMLSESNLNGRNPTHSTRRRRTGPETSPPQPCSHNAADSHTGSSFSFSSARDRLVLELPYLVKQAQQPSKMQGKNRYRNEKLWTGLFLVCIPVCWFLLVKTPKWNYTHNEIPLLIEYLLDENRDGGGWWVGSPLRYLPDVIDGPKDGLADYGLLVFVSLSDPKKDFGRTIRKDDYQLYHEEKRTQIDQMDKEHISKRHWFDDELEDVESTCRRPSWEKLVFPLCNAFHEVDFVRPYDAELAKRTGDKQDGESSYISHGYFRDVFSVSRPAANYTAVMKIARYAKHDINYRSIFNAKRDALIMERLTSSPNIVDIFGYCGSSIIVESLPHEVEEVIVPGGGWIKQNDLHDSEDLDIQNHYNASEKLAIAVSMAESIAELHGFRDGVIVHDDIQLCQWLRNDEGTLKLGDFNRARVLGWSESKQNYCKYENGRSYGNYRSPEEYSENPLSQQHDVWSFGNNIYALLSGLWIFYDNEDDEVVSQKVVNGTRPFIDPRYRNRSFIEGGLVEIMEKCWVYDMDQRPDIFEILKLLRQLQKDSDARESQG